MYEKGWGKKLNYVIALGEYDAIDVTQRYTENILALKRTLLSEYQLCGTLTQIRIERRRKLSDQMKNELIDRDLRDVSSFYTRNSFDRNDFGVRQTGSLEWRIARGEMGETKK